MDGEEERTEFIQIQTAQVEPDSEKNADYALINDGIDNEYWELEHELFHHNYLKEDDEWYNGTEKIKCSEILTDNLTLIAKI